jgi:hypothetical protein
MEKKVRIEYENRFITLKDETLKREMLISELDFKVRYCLIVFII